jgi:hypothetical protein
MNEVVSINSARSASITNRDAAAASTSAGGTSFSAALADAKKRPTGEKTQDVKDHAYDKIVAGPDKGEYLNRSGNARDGDAFRIVQRGGRTFHVYSTTKDHKVFELPKRGAETGGTPAA